ncbi:CopG family transcriptional regulator [Variovorax boronicumulans]|nr:CopG family transcriptional regulator [Variovorax boronicumulans]
MRISVLITKDERQRLKVMAASRGVTISEVIRQGIARFLGSAS